MKKQLVAKEKFKTGDYVLCSHNCTFYKINSIEKSGSLVRIHLSHKSGDITANGFRDDTTFVIKNFGAKSIETNLFPLDSVIQFFGWIFLALICLYFSMKIGLIS